MAGDIHTEYGDDKIDHVVPPRRAVPFCVGKNACQCDSEGAGLRIGYVIPMVFFLMVFFPSAYGTTTVQTYGSVHTAPTAQVIYTTDIGTGDLTVTSADLYTWRVVQCDIPGESDIVFSSGIPLVSRAMIDHVGLDWPESDFVALSGMDLVYTPNILVSDAIAYTYFFFDYGTLTEAVYWESPGGGTVEELVTMSEAFTNAAGVDKFHKWTLDTSGYRADDVLSIRFEGSTDRTSQAVSHRDHETIFQGGLPFGKPGYQTMEIMSTIKGGDSSTLDLQVGDVVYGYGIFPGVTMVKMAGGFTYQISSVTPYPNLVTDPFVLYRVSVGGTYDPFADSSIENSKKYAVHLRPQWSAQTEDLQEIVIPGSRITESGVVTCSIGNPWGADGANTTYSYTKPSRTPAVSQSSSWYTGIFESSDEFRSYHPGGVTLPGVPTAPGVVTSRPNSTIIIDDLPGLLIPPNTMNVTRTNTTGVESLVISGLRSEDFKGCEVFSLTQVKYLEGASSMTGGVINFTVPVDYDEPVRYTCHINNGTVRGTELAAAPLYLDLLRQINQENIFGWDSGNDFLGFGVVGFLALLSCTVGYNRRHLVSAGITFVLGIGLMGYLEILTVPQMLMSFLLVILILVIFQRRQ